jgi:hypothetical protein
MRGTNHFHLSSVTRRYLTVGSSARFTSTASSRLSLSRFPRIARKAAHLKRFGPTDIGKLGPFHVVNLLDSTFDYNTTTCSIVAGFSAL